MQKKLNACFDTIFPAEAATSYRIFENDDFFRAYLDYCAPGKNRELAVYANQQSAPEITVSENKTVYVYPSLTAEDGTVHDIRLTFTVESDTDGALHYACEIKNSSSVRLNELQYPLITLSKTPEEAEKDVLYLPDGLGRRVVNPYKDTLNAHTEYMAADYKNIIKMYKYPGQLSMPWLALETDGRTLYMGAHTKIWRQVSFVTETDPRESKDMEFTCGICSYPAAEPGETLVYDGYTVALFDGDWRECARLYKRWAEDTWYVKNKQKPGIREFTGWQRIILKHQYGEIGYTYDDLPRLYREGKKYGIRMILLFAWWEEGMDNGYPNYMPAEDLGGAEKLTKAIREINEDGGRVVLYANGHLIDVATDYYKTEGFKYTTKDIDGNDYREHYKFSNSGTTLKMGNKSFVTGCYGTKKWPEKIIEIEKRHLALGSNGTFFDQLGCGFYLCFDKTHTHKNRIDEDPELRLPTVKRIHDSLSDSDWFGIEWVIDRMTGHVDFTHGCGCGMTYTPDAYPYIFRYTFPENIVSNRFLHDEKPDFEKHLNYAFVHGMIFDSSVYRCRRSLEEMPAFGNTIKKLNDLRLKYADFFVRGSFDLIRVSLPEKVWGAEYTYEGTTIAAVWNDSGADFIMPYGSEKGAVLKSGEVKIFHV